ncbi:hypothetical protein SxD43FB_20770 [Sphingobium sp. D43FB]|nr:hypothetical protein SxD43FB_20770 [Sphingobium sp. D43FB]
MTLPSEAIPHGATNPDGRPFSWALRARPSMGNAPPDDWTHIVATGMIYAGIGGTHPRDVRVEVRNLELFVLPKLSRRWCMLDRASAPSGRHFRENFSGDAADRGATTIAKQSTLTLLQADRVFHFWGERVSLPKGGVAGVYVQYEARMVPARPGGSLTGKANYVGSASADYWKDANAPAGFVGTFNNDVAIGRFKRLSERFRLFTMNSNAWPAAR